MDQRCDTGRLHALDNLRAMLMWLGIVLHVGINHLTGPAVLPFKDTATTPVADLSVMFIHAFRMPAFFVLAGFLAAMMVASRGHGAMLRNRVRRIALPFAVFWPVLFIAMVALVLVWAHLMKFGTFGIDVAVAPKKSPNHASINTMHLWFLYYLFIFCVLGALACALGQRLPAASARLRAAVDLLARHWWGIPLLAIPMAIVGTAFPNGVLAPTGSFIPNERELIHYGMFFIFGWAVYRQREQLLTQFARRAWWYAAAGAIPYLVCTALFVSFIKQPGAIANIEVMIAYSYGLSGWLWSIALLGLFTRYLHGQNKVLRYLSDSSYWVFMVHMLGTMGFGALLFNAPLAGEVKMLVNIAATTLACLVSYHLLVRNTWIGVLLNGRRKAALPAGAKPAYA